MHKYTLRNGSAHRDLISETTTCSSLNSPKISHFLGVRVGHTSPLALEGYSTGDIILLEESNRMARNLRLSVKA